MPVTELDKQLYGNKCLLCFTSNLMHICLLILVQKVFESDLFVVIFANCLEVAVLILSELCEVITSVDDDLMQK